MAERLLTYREAVNEALRLEMRRDPRIIYLGEDVAGGAGRAHLGIVDSWGGPFGATKGLIQEFGPERVRDTPIAEQAFITAAVGAALTGLRPIAELMFVDFLGVALDAILNQLAKQRYLHAGAASVPLVIRTMVGIAPVADPNRPGGGTAAQHSQTLYPLLVHIPGIKCVAPSNAYYAKGLTIAAIRDDDPVVVCDHKMLFAQRAPVPEEAYEWPIGKAAIARPGRDVTLVGFSYTTHLCLQAAEALAKEGIEAEVIDLLSLSPLDEEAILESVRKTNRAVIVEESPPRCSVARDIAALIADQAFDYLDAPVKTVTAPHAHVPYSSALEHLYPPKVEQIVAAVHEQRGR